MRFRLAACFLIMALICVIYGWDKALEAFNETCDQ